MQSLRVGLWWLAALAVIASTGCAPKRKQVTERDRKEAAHIVSEAEFALTLRDWARAEGLLVKAVALSPEGEYWMTLGSSRVRLGNRAGARAAYEAAAKAFADDAARDETRVDPWLHQAHVLALLGRTAEAREILAKAAKRFAKDARVQALLDPKEFERIISSPGFKENAL